MIMARDPIPFHQIAAFEAAARNLGFSRAAQELNVQQPAVSRQVAALEEYLGAALFLRTKPRLTLTAEGEALLKAAANGFDALRAGLREVRAMRQTQALVVNAAIGFTSYYLLPRLGEFQSMHPDIRVQVVTRDQNPDFDPGQSDIVVTFGSDGPPGMTARRIVEEEMLAICAPDYLGSRAPLALEALAQEKLLHMSSAEHAGDWKRFFHDSGLVPPEPQEFERFNSFMVYLHAIQNGNGVGIGWRHLVERMIEAGSLALACSHSHNSGRGYFCSVTPRAEGRREAEEFLQWISGGAAGP
ncbi:hypothetical protein RA20_15960 [Leisingera sp. ANG-Vp]|nr:hypothetical protein RA20_15960 [Leisingera sp. ANG-Vp]